MSEPHDEEDPEIRALMARLEVGDVGASEALLQDLYGVLRSVARETMSHERGDHTLQPTALVHEAWIRLFHREDGAVPLQVGSRDHLVRLVARTMRRVLVDHARAKKTAKRGGSSRSLELDEVVARFDESGTDLVEFDDALKVLMSSDDELAQVVELKIFGGLSMEEIASVLGVSLATAERRWRVAKLWLLEKLG
ncbi:RNA polymerase sigma factor [Planctomycetes bacterium Poly30]|uniref:RNA polymerase sigma factor n=1 Tax=Saltatorellus ferox TaxID=2528018 RepID=A0A518EUH3_9BACT|nr:RNA polymerase sigma factor [Planctomycetes bacterium Poly30]